jgi:hypothetical protein
MSARVIHLRVSALLCPVNGVLSLVQQPLGLAGRHLVDGYDHKDPTLEGAVLSPEHARANTLLLPHLLAKNLTLVPCKAR